VTHRRTVRVAQIFFDRLDELLPAERTVDGFPSATDFLLHDLPSIIDALAEDYERLTTTIDGQPQIRVLLTSGMLVGHLAIYTVSKNDRSIVVVSLDIDHSGPVN
jgi:hypothetical protein